MKLSFNNAILWLILTLVFIPLPFTLVIIPIAALVGIFVALAMLSRQSKNSKVGFQ